MSATAIAGFADAAAVHWLLGEPYWAVWRNRLFSNILAQLTFVPAIVGVATALPRWLRGMPATRMAEADISLESILQKRSEIAANKDPHGRSGAPVPLVLITYAASEASIRSALEKIMGDGLIAEPPQVIRIERE